MACETADDEGGWDRNLKCGSQVIDQYEAWGGVEAVPRASWPIHVVIIMLLEDRESHNDTLNDGLTTPNTLYQFGDLEGQIDPLDLKDAPEKVTSHFLVFNRQLW